jgi:ribonuclease HII
MLTLGIDEAGRGPIIGPLVMAGVVLEEKGAKRLKRLGVRDSKLLTHKKREELFLKIIEIADSHQTIIVSPQEIDEAVGSVTKELNLNWLEADKTAELINALNPQKVIIDSPSRNIKNYSDYIKRKLKIKIELVAEHKADENHVECAAASIIAKVTRDRGIEKIKEEIGIDIGSGYLTDQLTQQFLEKCFETHGNLFRKSWIPYRLMLERKTQKTLDSFT